MTLTFVDWIIMLVYFVFVLGIGFALKRYMKTSTDFFLSGRSIPAWITGLAFISANLGAQEVIGMGASGAKYGIATSHFYWVGAIPAMVFVGIFMMPFYYGSRARSVPEYLKLRFDEKTRGFNAMTFAVMTVFSSGISMYALAKLLELIVGWNFHTSILLSAGLVPLVLLGLKDVGGWSGLTAKLETVATSAGFAPGAWSHSWRYLGSATANPMGVEWFGMAMGLGFVLSFGYWCTDFLVVQRAMAADSMASARRTPLIAAVPKMLFPFLVILPGLIAIALPTEPPAILNGPQGSAVRTPPSQGLIPAKLDATPGPPLLDNSGRPQLDYDLAVPNLLLHYFPTGILGLGLTALLASFMSGMAGNVTAFNTVWTHDIYEPYIKPNAGDAHYLMMGRLATIFGIALSIAGAYLATRFNNIMDMLQLVFAFVNAPLFATFLLGMFWKRATGHGAFIGLLSGTLAAAAHHALTIPAEAIPGVKGGWLSVLHTYPSEMAQNFWTAIFAWTTCFVVTILVSLVTKAPQESRLVGLVYSLTERPQEGDLSWYKRPAYLGVAILGVTVLLNFIFR